MNKQSRNISKLRFIEGSNSLLLKTPDGNSYFLNLNLVLYAVGLPYKKKNGEEVSADQIKKMKAKNHRRYMAAIEKNNQSSARTA